MTLTTVKPCPNCSANLETTDKFCPQCGQNTHIHRFNLPHIFHEVFHAFTHADKGVLHLLKNLTIRPGVTAREYILEGKRKRYFNPFTFLLLVVGLAVFVNSYFEPYGPTKPSTTPPPRSSTLRSSDQAKQQRAQFIFTLLNKRANLVAFAAIPVFTLVFWLFFIRTGINYAEQLVAQVFFAGYFQLFAALITTILGLSGNYISTTNGWQLGFQLIFLPIAYYQFLRYRQPVKYLLTLLATVLALGAWFIFSSQLIKLYITYGL